MPMANTQYNSYYSVNGVRNYGDGTAKGLKVLPKINEGAGDSEEDDAKASSEEDDKILGMTTGQAMAAFFGIPALLGTVYFIAKKRKT